MKAAAKEKLYLLIIIFSLLMCGVMIVNMLTGGFAAPDETHIPTMRSLQTVTETSGNTAPATAGDDAGTETNGQIALTEEFINEQLGRFLPSSFPLKNAEADIGADGIITFSGTVSKDELRQYLKDIGSKLGLRYSLALLLLPKNFDVSAAVTGSEGADGKLKIEPYSLYISEKSIPVSIIPKTVSNAVADAVNGLVSAIGGFLKFSGFEDGAILFETA